MKRLMAHIAAHLEELSLFVLPGTEATNLPQKIHLGILSSLNSAIDDISYYGEELPEIEAQGISLEDDAMEPPMPSTSHGIGAENLPGIRPTEHMDISSSPLMGDSPRSFARDKCGRVFDQIHKLKSVPIPGDTKLRVC